MRIKSEIWVKAYLRRCQVQGLSAVIVRRGDEHAGAIYICLNRLDGTVKLYGPAPAGLEGGESERRWGRCFATGPVGEGGGTNYLARPAKVDARNWLVEVENKAGPHFFCQAGAGAEE